MCGRFARQPVGAKARNDGDELKSSMLLLEKKQAETEADLPTAAAFAFAASPGGSPVRGVTLTWDISRL